MFTEAALAQLGERQTEDLKVPGSIPGGGIFLVILSNPVPVAKWIRRRFPEPKIEGSSPFRDAFRLCTRGLVGYDVCFTRRRSPVRSRAGVFWITHGGASMAQLAERSAVNR